ncbi:AcrID1 family anti-CRISPR protein, partial [Planomonospora alba]
TLKDMLNPIFENSEIWELDLIFNPEIELSDVEFADLIKNADPLQGVVNDSVNVKIYTDVYEWWEFENQYLEFELDYYVKDEKIFVLEMHFWRKIRK